jgi:hypothetical protein
MSDMTQSFIEMVEAFKAKPELEAQIKALGEDNAMCYKTIEQLRYELELANLSIADAQRQLSEVTKERDDASFRNLELDEKLAGIEKLLGVAERLEQARRDEHQATVDAMTPKPEPVPFHQEPIPDWMKSEPVDIVAGSGQSAADPTPSNATDSAQSPSQEAGIAPTEPKINPYTGFPINYPDGEYKGQPYYDKPSWVWWAAWCDAGGEAEPYMQQVTR